MAQFRKELIEVEKGFIDGFVVNYNSTTAITVTSGFYEANDLLYELSSDTSHTMTSLTTGQDFHYIYIDDDASTPPTATIIDSGVEPSWSDSKRGWYNGDDRMIGVIEGANGSATIKYFETNIINNKHIRNILGAQLGISLASLMNPNGSWQIPDDSEGSDGCPVNAGELKVSYTNSDAGAAVTIAITTEEMAAVNTSIINGLIYDRKYTTISSIDWIPLGTSRDLRIGGDDDDDNNLSMQVSGYGYLR